MAIQVGLAAPGFSAKAYDARADEFAELSLADFSGSWLCLFFYPMDFSFTCPQELASLATHIGRFAELGCRIAACSCDSHLAHKAWCDHFVEVRGLPFPLLADRGGRIAMDYGVLQPKEQVALRGTFLVDPEGVVRWMSVCDPRVGRSIEAIVAVLEKLVKMDGCGCSPIPAP